MTKHKRSYMRQRPYPTVTPRRVLVTGSLAAVALGAAACGGASGSANTSTTAVPKLTGSITVSAASSLTAAFGQLGTTFQSAHPGTTISFNFGSSGTLATQIQQGAPADVFASAAPANMATVQQAGDIVGQPVTFARNSLEIVVKPGNPLGIHSLTDLTKANVVGICVSTAPCGATAAQALQKSGVTIPTSKITLGPDVDHTLAEVTTGDADAAIVYVTNAKAVGTQGVGIPIPTAKNVSTSYPIAVVKGTQNLALAQAWIAYVQGPTGQRVLQAASFLPA
jgi:molybdate transport system substrate-binding protein